MANCAKKWRRKLSTAPGVLLLATAPPDVVGVVAVPDGAAVCAPVERRSALGNG